ncbi:Fic/DOC family protein [Alkaliphilus sp. B6464]|uniref:Fic/DOC family protein n=1 Tax=Alkaliphilus sp. B6464 TaxID=2731219 RepID=UPI001BA441C3|nr:Fic family protein [Alkaliphilus sp. B6464]QUH20417.1 Fic family protein [Alkaliphilus sp. B6464]
MNENYSYSYEWDSKYCYANSFVLKNKFNITNNEQLEIAEREYTALSIAEIKHTPVKGNLDLKHLQSIHKQIFNDIYDWAGELRTVNISKGNSFYNHMYILEGAEEIFSKLKRENYLIGISQPDIHDKLAYYLGEINVLHPFREGNGRAQRIFIEYLAQVAGYSIDFSNITDIEMIEASVEAFNCNYNKMTEIFKKATKTNSREEQVNFINSIALKNSSIVKTYEKLYGEIEDVLLEDDWDLER